MNTCEMGAKAEREATEWLEQQGFEVFVHNGHRSTADLIAVKEKEIYLFDVKLVGSYTFDNKRFAVNPQDRLNKKQKALGVRPLYVSTEGVCTTGLIVSQEQAQRLLDITPFK